MQKTVSPIFSYLIFDSRSKEISMEIDSIGESQNEEDLEAKTNDDFVNGIGSKLPSVYKSTEHGESSDYEWISTGATTINFSGIDTTISGSGAAWRNSALINSSGSTVFILPIATQEERSLFFQFLQLPVLFPLGNF